MLVGVHGPVVEGSVLPTAQHEIAADAPDSVERGTLFLSLLLHRLDEGGLAVPGVAREDCQAQIASQQGRDQLMI